MDGFPHSPGRSQTIPVPPSLPSSGGPLNTTNMAGSFVSSVLPPCFPTAPGTELMWAICGLRDISLLPQTVPGRRRAPRGGAGPNRPSWERVTSRQGWAGVTRCGGHHHPRFQLPWSCMVLSVSPFCSPVKKSGLISELFSGYS